MLTLYYASATFLQSWRIQKVCSKITEQLAQQSSIAFYTLHPGNEDGFDTAFATSELCINRNAAKVSEMLWLYGNQRGCCLRPLQTVHITPWVTFPGEQSWLPFAQHVAAADGELKLSKQRFNLLLETLTEPQRKIAMSECEPMEEVKLEDYGKLIAWKIDSHLAVLIETDVEHFTKFLINTFLRNNLLINDQLPLLRIESVQQEGKPQPFELLASHLRRSTRSSLELSDEDWQRHLEDLRALNVLAAQATEFQYNKNRTDAKAGVVKPDLIPLEKQKLELQKKQQQQQQKQEKSITPTKKTPVKSVNVHETKKLIAAESKTSESKNPQATNENSSRFTTTKVIEDPILATTTSKEKVSPVKAAGKASELEKIAAATAAAVARKQKSPVRGAAISQQTPNTPTSSNASTATTVTPAKTAASTAKTVTTPSKTSTTTAKTSTTATPVTATPTQSTSTAADTGAVPPTKRPSLRRHKNSLRESKPLNVLVYSDSPTARDATVATLRQLLTPNTYTIYAMTPQQVEQKFWLDHTALLVVCGMVTPVHIGEILVDYFLHGGKVLSLCSDILHFILPNYRTAEVREHELVQFSYDKWQKVKMMHHIFCYQPSPVKKHFSTDSEESSHSRKPSIELKDLKGQLHKLDVKVLGTEETWNTPSLLLASSTISGGKAVFSQVHLETSPSEFEYDEHKYKILKQNEQTRLEIFADLLNKYLDVEVLAKSAIADIQKEPTTAGVIYKNAFFLGRHESKFELLDKLKSNATSENVIQTKNLTLYFCGAADKPIKANNNVLPILIHSCPDDFSTVDYFDILKTRDIGRLVIYAPVVSTAMHVINDLELMHGIAIIPRMQTAGVGRSGNQWLSPSGCAMFAIQLHIGLDSALGACLPLVQHIVGAAIANTLRAHPIYKDLPISLKWPNDIYANGIHKIGGLLVNTKLHGKQANVNIGAAVNLDNSKPTICINELISDYNKTANTKMPVLKYEQFIALIFNEIEYLIDVVQKGDFDSFYKLYYSLWLHTDQMVTISTGKDSKPHTAKIIGIDDFGYLRVQLANGNTEIVQPDGNSFDILKGLIVPKYY